MRLEYIKSIYDQGDQQQAIDLLRVEHTNSEVLKTLEEWGPAPKCKLSDRPRFEKFNH